MFTIKRAKFTKIVNIKFYRIGYRKLKILKVFKIKKVSEKINTQ
jgi:hypothetical protein